MGYLGVVWTNEIFGSSAEDVDLRVYGMEDVLIDQITDDWDIQKAYAVTIYERVPTIRMRQHWPLQAEWIYPSSLGLEEHGVKGSAVNSSYARPVNQNAVMGLVTGNDGISNPKNSNTVRGLRTKIGTNAASYTDAFFTYINDASLNATNRVIKSDEITETDDQHLPGYANIYPIAPVGTPISLADEPPQIYSPEFCRLYPARRLIIWTPDHILYDGPSFYFHGNVPLIKFQLDPMAWSRLIS